MNWRSIPASGEWVLPGEVGYDLLRSTFNRVANRRPIAIFKPADAHALAAVLSHANAHGIHVTVKGGGHSCYGHSVRDESILIILSHFMQGHVDASSLTLTMGAGAQLKDLWEVLLPSGLGMPTGDCPDVGVAGFTLGGGNGLLSRKYGLACDNLVGMEMVTANGDILWLDTDHHAELFQLMRGAGHCNFGIVTRFVFKLVHMPERMAGGIVYWPIEEAASVLQKYFEWMESAPNGFNANIGLNTDFEGRAGLKLYGLFDGDLDEGIEIFQRVRSWGHVMHDQSGIFPYPVIAKMNAEASSIQPSFHWKNRLLTGFNSVSFARELVASFMNRPNDFARINLDPLSGAIQTPSMGMGGFAHRKNSFILSFIGVWLEENDATASRDWTDQSWRELSQYGTEGIYPNYFDVDLRDASLRAHTEPILRKAREAKLVWDPSNTFRGTINEIL